MTTRKRATSKKTTREPRLSRGALALAAVGRHTEDAVRTALANEPSSDLFSAHLDGQLKALARALEGWDDEKAARVVAQLFTDRRDRIVDIDALCRWVGHHVNDPTSVHDCMAVVPPEKVTLLRLLSRAGSQKLVFLAAWNTAQKTVVLKRFLSSGEARRRIEEREAQSHPLSMDHPNIIKTYFMTNREGEGFLVEEFLPETLSDGWRSHGLQEAANLLWDIVNALHYLHTDLQLAHGDVKPGNIGRRGRDYLLLDFGICRPINEFAGGSATGSLRTRAPELLEAGAYADPRKADVWAAAATVFNAVVGRYPLFDHVDRVPRVSSPPARAAFEAELGRRVRDEWAVRVDLTGVAEPLRGILQGALDRDPDRRSSTHQILEVARRQLAGFLRNQSGFRHFSPVEELQWLTRCLPPPGTLHTMPSAERDVLGQRLEALAGMGGVPEEVRARALDIAQNLSEASGSPPQTATH